jgi:hypothetical protein
MKVYLSHWWRYNIQYPIYNFLKGFKNLINWIPVIWNDSNNDFTNILIILKKKLELQSKYIKKYSNNENSLRDCQRIELCIRLIDRINEEYYTTEYTEYFKSKISFIDVDEDYYKQQIPSGLYTPGMKRIQTTLLSENLDEYFLKYKRIHNYVMTTNNKLPLLNENSFNIAFNIAYINHDRTKRLLFKILKEYLETWWY